ncbi:hypothetical protein BBJ28_00002319 [Nothophytophthora sp. Chile5]|nr:hypothetical protein BBJ28_00002319 [Nothophytophthora sp. Chile5]
MAKHSSPPRKASSASSSESLTSSVASAVRTVPSHLAIDEEEAELTQKAAAVKRFAKHCQRDIETNAVAIRSHHQQLQAAYMKELQRKYDSKRHMTLMALREKHEADTKALVRAKMEAYELEEATAVKNVRKSILEERKRAQQELQDTHEVAMEEHVARLKVQLTAETQSEQRALETQLQEELRVKLKELQDGNCEELERWEIEKRREIELQLFTRREAAVASILKAQEEGTAVLKKEIQSTHLEKEEVELRKLQKALAFGAQAQLQQLRKRLETDHEEKLTEIKNEAALSLERQSAELKQMLTRSHNEQQEQLERDLEKKNRVAVMELHDSMQISHQQRLEGLRDAADQQNTEALATHRLEFELECQQELELLEQALDQEMTAKLSQLEMEQEEECELKLEQLRVRAVHNHARELEAKKSRMMQCKNVLLAEASAFLSLENSFSYDGGASEVETEASSAAGHLHQLKKHLSKELAQYVDVMLAEFDELAEEQRILVAKIAESTQLYLSYKKRCGVLETQSLELTSGLETLHDQLQKKDAVCKKLYQANEALLKRIQTPVLQISTAENDIASSSPRIGQSPALTKTLRAAASRQKGRAERSVDDMRL